MTRFGAFSTGDMDVLKLAGAVVLGLFALALWYGFVRTVPVEAAAGVIRAKVHKPAGQYTVTPVGLDRGFRMPSSVPIGEAYVLTIELEDIAGAVAAVVNPLQARSLDVGDRIRIHYQRRGFPPLWERLTVTRVESAHP
jgi:hypothetical protein